MPGTEIRDGYEGGETGETSDLGRVNPTFPGLPDTAVKYFYKG